MRSVCEDRCLPAGVSTSSAGIWFFPQISSVCDSLNASNWRGGSVSARVKVLLGPQSSYYEKKVLRYWDRYIKYNLLKYNRFHMKDEILRHTMRCRWVNKGCHITLPHVTLHGLQVLLDVSQCLYRCLREADMTHLKQYRDFNSCINLFVAPISHI